MEEKEPKEFKIMTTKKSYCEDSIVKENTIEIVSDKSLDDCLEIYKKVKQLK